MEIIKVLSTEVTIDIAALSMWLGVLLTLVSVIALIVKPLNNIKKAFEKECKRNQYQDKQIVDSLEQRHIMTVTLLAILEGLIQQGCNHNVTKQYNALNDYLNDRPFRCDWYKDDKEN